MRDSSEPSPTQRSECEAGPPLSDNSLECIAAEVPGSIYQLRRDLNGCLHFPFFSASARTFFELDPDRIQADAGQLLDRIHPEDRDLFDRSLAHSAARLETWCWQGRFILPSGKIKWVRASANPQKNPDKSILWQGLLVEISSNSPSNSSPTSNASSQNPNRENIHATPQPTEPQLKLPLKLQILEQALDTLPQAYFWKDLSSRYLGCDRQFARLVGLEHPEEIVGKTDRDLPWKPEIASTLQHLDATALTHRTSTRQILESPRFTHPPQTWFETQTRLLEDELGNPIAIWGTIEDITERKQIDKALLSYQNELLTLFRAMQDVILVFDANGCFLRIVPTNPPPLSRMPPEVIGKTLHEILPTETADFLVSQIHKTLKTQTTTHIEHHLTLEGKEIWFDVSIAPLQAHNVIWVARDITERKQAELERSQSQQQLQAILDYAPALISIENLAGEYLVLNRQAQQVLNLDSNLDLNLEPQASTDSGSTSLPMPEKSGSLQQNPRDFIDRERPIATEEILSLPDGLHTYLTVKFPLKNASGSTYAIGGISTDITQQKQAEETLRRNEAKLRHKTQQLEQTLLELRQTQAQLIHTEKMSSLGQLVAGVAHEINNPANFIHANLNHARLYIQDLLKLVTAYRTEYPQAASHIQEIADEIDLDFLLNDLPKLLGSMQVGTQRIRGVVKSLRTFSRLGEAEFKRIDLHEGIESTLALIRYRLEPKVKPAIQVIREYGNLPQITCYAGQLSQVFLNILTNAIDALNEAIEKWDCSAPIITIQTEILDGDRVSICIGDNGPGIPESVQKRMFDPFFTTKPPGKGTGLGMSVCDRIITQLHGGELQCVSRLGEGATFTIVLPIYPPAS
ncbi:MAG: PAS domain-containing protein [Cyanobacteriota bacterium]|nr:PAS domain-containing protein [Cyanobacteriota bacterium]